LFSGGKVQKFFIVIVFLFFVILWVYPDEKEYQRNELTIEAKSGAFSSWSKDFTFGVSQEFTSWRYFQGFTRITEPEFLQIAGYGPESVLSQKFRSGTIALATTSFSLLGVSLGLLGVGTVTGIVDPPGWRDTPEILLYSSLGVNFLALIPAIILLVRGEKWLPLEKAISIRDSYNARLKASLQ
jgi:hypothetical protein